jgi:hypothetical protein
MEMGWYMFNGSYNPFVHSGVTSPQSCVILRKGNKLQVTGRVHFTYRDHLPKLVRNIVSQPVIDNMTDAVADADAVSSTPEFDKSVDLEQQRPTPPVESDSGGVEEHKSSEDHFQPSPDDFPEEKRDDVPAPAPSPLVEPAASRAPTKASPPLDAPKSASPLQTMHKHTNELIEKVRATLSQRNSASAHAPASAAEVPTRPRTEIAPSNPSAVVRFFNTGQRVRAYPDSPRPSPAPIPAAAGPTPAAPAPAAMPPPTPTAPAPAAAAPSPAGTRRSSRVVQQPEKFVAEPAVGRGEGKRQTGTFAGSRAMLGSCFTQDGGEFLLRASTGTVVPPQFPGHKCEFDHKSALHASLDDPTSVTDIDALLAAFADDLNTDAGTYARAANYCQETFSKDRAPGAPSRDAFYGQNADVDETLLSAMLDQLYYGTEDCQELVLEVDYSSVVDSESLENTDAAVLAHLSNQEDLGFHKDTAEMLHGTLGRMAQTFTQTPQPTPNETATPPLKIPGSDLKVKLEQYQLADMKGVSKDDQAKMLAAIAKELTDLIKVGCFEVVEMPYNRNAIASRIVLKVKYRADGTYDKHKARLVAKGFMERLGSDFFSTYSPMASLTTARALMAIAVNMRLPVLHSDIPQAFIKSLIDTDIWLKLPNGVKFLDGKGNAHQIVKLVRSLYGLRQSPQLFNKELNRFMHSEGFVQTTADACLFTKTTANGWLLVASEVDDLLVTGTDKKAIEDFRVALVKEYSITDWEPLKSFLGINIQYEIGKRMTLDVEYKLDKLLEAHPMLQNHLKSDKRSEFPFLEEHMAIPDTKPLTEVDKYIQERYASLNGALIYMGITCRPDFTYALAKTSRGMHDPKPRHVIMLKQLLKYAFATKDYALTFDVKPEVFNNLDKVSKTDTALSFIAQSDGDHVRRFHGYADANFANLRDDERKSNTGYCFFLFGCAITWKSKLQPITATSTHEAELIACAAAAYECIWIRKLFQDLGNMFGLAKAPAVNLRSDKRMQDVINADGEYPDPEKFKLDPLWLFNDNLGTTQTINRPETTSMNSRHIDTRYFRIRQHVARQDIRVAYLGTDYNVADFFTKGLTNPKFKDFRHMLGLRSLVSRPVAHFMSFLGLTFGI